MKSVGLTFIAIFTFLSCFAQSLPSPKEQYDFLNWYITYKKPDRLKQSLVRISNAQILTGDGFKMMKVKITNNERSYFSKQMIANQPVTNLDTALLNHADWKKPGEPDQPFTQLSLPLFSRDRKLVIITNNYYNLQTDPGNSETGLELYVKVKKDVWRPCALQPFDKQTIISQSE